jgi:hypothetical protein
MRAILAAITVAAATLVACTGPVIGSGKVETERRTVPAFSSISAGGSGTIRIHRGPSKLEVTTDSNLLQYIQTEVVGTELRIYLKPGVAIARVSKLEIEVSMPDLVGLDLSGSASTTVDAFDGKAFKATLSGSGSLKADLAYDSATLHVSGSGDSDLSGKFGKFALDISGSGDTRLAGSAEELRIGVSGSGRISAKDFQATRARLDASGSADVEMRATESIAANLSGSGRLRYWGNPVVDARTSGSSKVVRAGD